jgi:putative two-component system response regulator
MDGYEVCRRLRENPLTCDIQVIFVTAASDNESEIHGLQLGAVDYITKPISPAIALLRVRNQLLLRQSLYQLRLASIVFENTTECMMANIFRRKNIAARRVKRF